MRPTPPLRLRHRSTRLEQQQQQQPPPVHYWLLDSERRFHGPLNYWRPAGPRRPQPLQQEHRRQPPWTGPEERTPTPTKTRQQHYQHQRPSHFRP